MSYYGLSTRDNPEQQEFVKLLNDNSRPIIICYGSAGTGKTYTAIATALQLLYEHKYDHIIYTRENIELGRSLGFLPGDISQKFSEPYSMPIKDTLENMFGYGIDYAPKTKYGNTMKELRKSNKKAYPKYTCGDAFEKIEAVPISFLRGSSKTNSLIIVDESENLDMNVINTLTTRIGRDSKIVFIGSFNQIDDPMQRNKTMCDFETAVKKVFSKEEFKNLVGIIELTKSMRAPWTVDIDNAFHEIEKKEQ